MILAFILESIPWCHLVVGILFLGSWTRDSPYLHHVDSVASSFSILVTFVIVLEVRGISFFQIPWTIMAEVCWIKRSQQALYEFSMLYCDSASSTFLHGLSGRIMLKSFDMLIHASTTRKVICSFELSLFSCILTLVHQLLVKSSCALVLSMPIILVVRQAILFRND